MRRCGDRDQKEQFSFFSSCLSLALFAPLRESIPLPHPPPRRGEKRGGGAPNHEERNVRCTRLTTRLPQPLCCFAIEVETASFLIDHHAIIAPGGFERNIPGAHIG